MANFTHKEGSGSLFKNDKQGNENRPDYRGEVMIGGVLHEIAAWLKDGQKGKFMSLSVKVKDSKQSAKSTRAPVDDSEIPF